MTWKCNMNDDGWCPKALNKLTMFWRLMVKVEIYKIFMIPMKGKIRGHKRIWKYILNNLLFFVIIRIQNWKIWGRFFHQEEEEEWKEYYWNKSRIFFKSFYISVVFILVNLREEDKPTVSNACFFSVHSQQYWLKCLYGSRFDVICFQEPCF